MEGWRPVARRGALRARLRSVPTVLFAGLLGLGPLAMIAQRLHDAPQWPPLSLQTLLGAGLALLALAATATALLHLAGMLLPLATAEETSATIREGQWQRGVGRPQHLVGASGAEWEVTGLGVRLPRPGRTRIVYVRFSRAVVSVCVVEPGGGA